MTKNKLFRIMASALAARINCIASHNTEWFSRHSDSLTHYASDYLPCGSGFDSGTTINLDRSTGERIVLETAFHHMDEYGGYDGWTDHTITVKPSLLFGFTLTISGPDRNGIKDYMYEVFQSALSEEVEA